MVTLIIDSCCDFVKTSEWTPRGGLKVCFLVTHLIHDGTNKLEFLKATRGISGISRLGT